MHCVLSKIRNDQWHGVKCMSDVNQANKYAVHRCRSKMGFSIQSYIIYNTLDYHNIKTNAKI